MRTLDTELYNKPLDESKRRKIYHKRENLRRIALTRYQEDWLEKDYLRTVSFKTLEPSSKSQHEALDCTMRNLRTLKPFMPERARLADKLSDSAPCFELTRKEAVQDITAIYVSKDQRACYRPNEIPIKGRYPVIDCRIKIDKSAAPLSSPTMLCS